MCVHRAPDEQCANFVQRMNTLFPFRRAPCKIYPMLCLQPDDGSIDGLIAGTQAFIHALPMGWRRLSAPTALTGCARRYRSRDRDGDEYMSSAYGPRRLLLSLASTQPVSVAGKTEKNDRVVVVASRRAERPVIDERRTEVWGSFAASLFPRLPMIGWPVWFLEEDWFRWMAGGRHACEHPHHNHHPPTPCHSVPGHRFEEREG